MGNTYQINALIRAAARPKPRAAATMNALTRLCHFTLTFT